MKQILFIVLFNIGLIANNSQICQTLFAFYRIDPNIKSSNGWSRAFYKKKIYIYIPNLKDIDIENIKECFKQNGFDIKKHKRSIGESI